MPIKTVFTDRDGRTFTVIPEENSIGLIISPPYARGNFIVSVFHLDPSEFGDVAAALWECSPTKQPIKITGTPEEDTAKEAGEGAHKSEDGSSQSTKLKYQVAEGGGEETASQRTGPGATVDAGTKNAGEERGKGIQEVLLTNKNCKAMHGSSCYYLCKFQTDCKAPTSNPAIFIL